MSPRAVADTARLHRALQSAGRRLYADFRIPDDADPCALLGGAPDALGWILDSSRALIAAGIPVRWRVPILDSLVYRLEAIFSLAHDEGVDPLLTRGPIAARDLDPETRRFAEDFVQWRLLAEDRDDLPETRAAAYRLLLEELQGQPSPRSPAEAQMSLLAPAEAAASSSRTRRAGEPAGEVAGVLAEGLRAIGQWVRAALAGRARGAATGGQARTLPRVLVIGAYGGDHIGDTAIVGGVLLRMHARYGTHQAILVSQRPAHTARLAAMLDTPVRVTVEEYLQSTAAALLAQVDGVVFAGGPLMDLPKQLVKHLYVVSHARRGGKPFVIEGIGAGPFIRQVSAWTARLLVRMAERITVRTAADGRQPLVHGLQPIVGRDPAFDYLETRGPGLTRLPDVDRVWLERLLSGTEGRATIGINLRPLRPDYTVGAPASQRAAYTRQVEAQFEERLAEAMRRFHREYPPDVSPCFIFYPMNAIQFGSSDLRSAYRLKRLAGPDVDLRIWEGDPTIDGVIALLRRVDVAITMRFHATIYAISQRTPVIGVDYRPGKKDKVAALLDDLGEGHNCARIDEMTVDWMFDRLRAQTSRGRNLSRRSTAGGSAESSPRPVLPPVPS